MPLELLTGVNVQEGLRELGDSAYSMGQNMLARVETPVLDDGTDLWRCFLDSKTINHYGGVNEDNRHQFKVDNEPDLGAIVNAAINSDGSISTSQQAYEHSPPTGFVIVGQSDLEGTNADYAIRTDKYEAVREQLSQGRYKAEDLEKAGGFKANVRLKPEEIIRYKGENVDELTLDDIEYVHDGWLEHAVGKSNATQEEYLEAAKSLARYVAKAQEERCFNDGTGMGFFVRTDVDDYKVRPWFVFNSDFRYSASGWSDFFDNGQFLRVRDESAEGAAPEISPKIGYDKALKVVLGNNIRNEIDAAALLGKVNEFYQGRVQAQR